MSDAAHSYNDIPIITASIHYRPIQVHQTRILTRRINECSTLGNKLGGAKTFDVYTVNHKKGGSTFVTITLENIDRFL